MPDRPATREPLPFRPAAAGCCYSIHVAAGQWGTCGDHPAVTGVWVSERLTDYEQQTHQDVRHAEELKAAADDLLSRLEQ